MFATAFLPASVFVIGYSISLLPVIDSQSVHLHVAKQGRWMLSIEEKGHLRNGNDADTQKAFELRRDDIVSWVESRLELKKRDFECQANLTGERQGMIVLIAEGDDSQLFSVLDDSVLEFNRYTGNWDGNCLSMRGFPQQEAKRGSLEAMLEELFSVVFFGGPSPEKEIVLTTDGCFGVEQIPCEIEDDGQKLVLDVSKLSESPNKIRELSIFDLGE